MVGVGAKEEKNESKESSADAVVMDETPRAWGAAMGGKERTSAPRGGGGERTRAMEAGPCVVGDVADMGVAIPYSSSSSAKGSKGSRGFERFALSPPNSSCAARGGRRDGCAGASPKKLPSESSMRAGSCFA